MEMNRLANLRGAKLRPVAANKRNLIRIPSR